MNQADTLCHGPNSAVRNLCLRAVHHSSLKFQPFPAPLSPQTPALPVPRPANDATREKQIPFRKPHRALIWLGDVPGSWRPPENWSHPDVIYEAAIPAGSRAPEWLPEKTKLHSLPPFRTDEDITRAIRSLDVADTLPFDFIITGKAAPALARAAAAELFPLVSLP